MKRMGARSTLIIGMTTGLALAAMPRLVLAAQSVDEAFHDYFRQVCNAPGIAFGSPLFQTCDAAFGQPPLDGGVFVPGAAVSNLSISGGQGTSSTMTALQQRKELKARLRDPSKPLGGGASFDFSRERLGGFVTLAYANVDRDRTSDEQGYDSDLVGALAGLDYRFTDALRAGASLGYAADNVNFDQHSGGLDTKSKSITLYTAYTPRENLYLGAYAGYSDLDFDGTRNVAFGGIAGTTKSSSDGDQWRIGASAVRDWPMGNWTGSAYGNLDYVSTDIDGYAEKGSTGLEMVYSSQTSRSFTSVLGVRASGKYGTVTPEFRVGWVHEFKNGGRNIDMRLALAPGSSFTMVTDKADHNYLVSGIGASVEAVRGVQMFIDYERMDAHSYLGYWAISAGLLGQF